MTDMIAEYRRGVLYLDAGDPIEAAKILETVLVEEPGNAEVRLWLARAYFGSAQLNRAEAQLRALVDRDPTDHYACHLLGRTLERQSRGREALPYLRLAAAMADVPDYAKAVERVAAKH
ncbi:tetratricopeptide repeat protein [Dactylosporangium sp. AC04546]|uniref:tetratricopeptide repeat protein n=1 Tax=Dactylosporangium sp. AC04546 TaxID=2862460 RepID=UPI001EDD9082|nr:tetratricopeptide repeat protein [Dactylosporangium sp. AC04546]WVK78270.1 tetratricopeptide repeat protein [Dactylosporangium sp. AC04546]